ncbi:hypothetical protein LPJ53_001878 [Coemansia erecta]|uniref:C2H2-type domain-containing protein n=1 Tax=Coemansia erecta TaxID=147472 RepID=A0A9W7XZ79_9FUNG|nr:hypothetical protein LPJ53_001878 [Coemansia erecta]
MRHRGPKLDLGLADYQDAFSDDQTEHNLTDTLLHRLGYKRRRPRVGSCNDLFAQSILVPSPPTITRIDPPHAHSELALPALDIEQIIRHKDEHTAAYAALHGVVPETPTSSVSAQTAVDSDATSATNTADRSSTDTAAFRLPSVEFLARPQTQRTRGASFDMFSRPTTAQGRPSTGGRRLRHDYFRVATMDGKPVIPAVYRCPIALCQMPFAHFEPLQVHWTEHPWNRGGILTPVCDGGVRRLGWWEHKRKFFASLVQGRNSPEFPEDRGSEQGRRRSKSIDEACRSDYGDISLLGSRTYHVSPRIVPMWQVAQWETLRDAVN